MTNNVNNIPTFGSKFNNLTSFHKQFPKVRAALDSAAQIIEKNVGDDSVTFTLKDSRLYPNIDCFELSCNVKNIAEEKGFTAPVLISQFSSTYVDEAKKLLTFIVQQ